MIKHELMDRYIKWSSWVPIYRDYLATKGASCMEAVYDHAKFMVRPCNTCM